MTARSASTSRATPATAPTRRLYYFAGGGWQMPPSSQHWRRCAELVRQVPGLAISVVSAPHAPHSPANVALPQLGIMCASVLKQGEQSGERIVFGGDSSGGNLALCLTLQGLMDDGPGRSPDAVLLICPSVDLRPMSVEGSVKYIFKKDPILTINGHNDEAAKWSKGSDTASPLISPVTADMSMFAKADVKVLGITGGYDILTPDAIELRDKCKDGGVHGAWLEWDKQMHCFPLTFMYRVPEAIEAKNWIVEHLKKI
ncbi:hypothetical protein ANO11243_020140 [Dothideomycetidae sp. 11243]|nr:hypothetical protein ANO11243_020140 [fungal sp. No.11243]